MTKALRTFKTFGIGDVRGEGLDDRLKAIFRGLYPGQGLPRMVAVARSRESAITEALARLELGAVAVETLGGILSTELWVVAPSGGHG